ncbi:MAG: hypothetical protein E6G97_04110 [Alphaproteobacteria bacterium]|nr:MAG: hypothetical protein E6G97_04110 [Alphaproteobacteria bacterium]
MNLFPQILPRALLGALAGLILAAAPARAADPVFPVNSRIGLVAPAGFTPSSRFSGFENPQASAAILLVELPADAYADVEKGFTDEALKARGMTVQLREPLTFKDGKGFFVSGPQESGGQKRHEAVMVATLNGVTAIVSLQMVEATRATLTDAIMRNTFQTLAVRQQVPEAEKLAVLPYKIGNLAKFRIVRSAREGVAILTDGPNDEVTAVEQPFMLVAVAPGEPPKVEDRDKFARQLFGTLPGLKDVKITRSEPLRIGQAQGYEIVADAKDTKSSTDVSAVQWVRFGQSGYLRMFAIVRKSAWSDVFPRLRAIRDSIEPR